MYLTIAKVNRDVLTKPSTGLLSISILSALWTFSSEHDFCKRLLINAMERSKGGPYLGAHLCFYHESRLASPTRLVACLTLFGRMLAGILYNFWQCDRGLYQQLLTMTEPTIYLMLFLSLILLFVTQ